MLWTKKSTQMGVLHSKPSPQILLSPNDFFFQLPSLNFFIISLTLQLIFRLDLVFLILLQIIQSLKAF